MEKGAALSFTVWMPAALGVRGVVAQSTNRPVKETIRDRGSEESVAPPSSTTMQSTSMNNSKNPSDDDDKNVKNVNKKLRLLYWSVE